MDDPNNFRLTSHPDPRHSHRVLLHGLAALLIIIIAVSGGYLLGTKNMEQSTHFTTPSVISQITPTPTIPIEILPTIDPSVTSNWKTYTLQSDRLKYLSFRYPSTWEVHKILGSCAVIEVGPKATTNQPPGKVFEDGTSSYVYVYPRVSFCPYAYEAPTGSPETFDEFVKFYLSRSTLQELQSGTVDGEKYYIIGQTPTNKQAVKDYTILIDTPYHLPLIMAGDYDQSMMKKYAIDQTFARDSFIATMNQILSTLTFTSKTNL